MKRRVDCILEIIFFYSILLRRIIWLITCLTTCFTIFKTIQHHPIQDTGFAFFICGYEWIFREFLYSITSIHNPLAHWWERRLCSVLSLVLLLLCVIINKIVLSGGIRQSMRNAAVRFFKIVDFLKKSLIRLNIWPYFTEVQFLLTIIFIVTIIFSATASSGQENSFFISIFLLITYTFQFAYKSLSSVRKLLLFWLFSTIFIIPLSSVIVEFGFSKHIQNNDSKFWIRYSIFIAIFIVWWCITACMADDDVAKLAVSFTNAIATIGTIICNIFLVFAEQFITVIFDNSPDGGLVYGAIVVGINMIFLPVLTASLLASFMKDLQIYINKQDPFSTNT